MLKVEDAKKELETKDYIQIQEETAWKWASRAAASFERVLSLDHKDGILELSRADDYFGEAKEHAAHSRFGLLLEIKSEVEPYMVKALSHLLK